MEGKYQADVFKADEVEKAWREREMDPSRLREETPRERPVYFGPSAQLGAWKFTILGFLLAMLFVLFAGAVRRKRDVVQQRIRKEGSRGFSLVELLVVMAIISVLLGLILPAAQQARESARRTQCINNLKQIGLALHNYEGNWGKFPRGVTFYEADHPQSTWAVGLLPFLEMNAEYQSWDFGKPPWEGANADVAKKGGLVFVCPSMVEDGDVMLGYGKVRGTSYFPVGKVSEELKAWLAKWGDLPDADFQSVLGVDPTTKDFRNRSLAEVRDGLSNTLVLVESCGGNRRHGDHAHSFRVEGGSVYHPDNPFVLNGVDEVGASPGAGIGISNADINQSGKVTLEPFSFHSGRMNVLLSDGSVRGVSWSIALNELIKVIGIADGTTVSEF